MISKLSLNQISLIKSHVYKGSGGRGEGMAVPLIGMLQTRVAGIALVFDHIDISIGKVFMLFVYV